MYTQAGVSARVFACVRARLLLWLLGAALHFPACHLEWMLENERKWKQVADSSRV